MLALGNAALAARGAGCISGKLPQEFVGTQDLGSTPLSGSLHSAVVGNHGDAARVGTFVHHRLNGSIGAASTAGVRDTDKPALHGAHLLGAGSVAQNDRLMAAPAACSHQIGQIRSIQTSQFRRQDASDMQDVVGIDDEHGRGGVVVTVTPYRTSYVLIEGGFVFPNENGSNASFPTADAMSAARGTNRTKGFLDMAIKVKARGGETVEQMVRRFKKLCEKDGLTKEVKRRQYYEKPSEIKRRAAIRRAGPRPLLGRPGSRPGSPSAAPAARTSGGRSGSGSRSSGGSRDGGSGGGGRSGGRGA